MAPVAYPASLNNPGSVTVGRQRVWPDHRNVRLPLAVSRTWAWPECLPVIRQQRDRAHTAFPEYARVNRIPSLAIASMFGVRIFVCP